MLTITFLAAFVIINAQTQERTRETIPVTVTATHNALMCDVAQIGRASAAAQFLEAKAQGPQDGIHRTAFLSSFTIGSITQS